MIINAVTKFNFGDKVAVRFSKYKPDTIQAGIILDVRLYKSRHFGKEGCMIYYSIEPLEYSGFEHDEEEWILEQSILGKD